jgi:apolipoprotein N-acyltransferase
LKNTGPPLSEISLKAKMKKFLLVLLALVGSAVMLTLIQAPTSLSALAWVAMVPFILACWPEVKIRYLFFTAYIVSLCYWLGNLYWMLPVTPAGWVAFCMYTALLWPILAVCVRYCRIRKIPLVLAVPVLIIGAERLQGLFLGGFFWRHLSHSQYANITLIQIADIFGAAGISFLIAMVNALAAELIIAAEEKNIFKIGNLLKVGLVCGALAGAVIYGRYRINEADKYIEAGPLVASVQTNVPQSVKQSFAAEQQILDGLLDQSNQCLQSKPELIVWPETMVQAILEPEVLRLLDEKHQYKQFDKIIRGLAAKGVYLLVGAYGGTPRIEENFDIRMAQKFNAAFLYQLDGSQAPEKYYKIHLVPFGEYLPFEDIPFIHNLMLKMTPYTFDYTLDAGKKYTAFEIKSSGGNPNARVYKFSVIICYEDAVPATTRHFVLDKNGRKRIDWLVNISNDGWFVRFANDKVLPSTELSQHTAICVFRAVENRLAVVRSVNTGVSCLIDTLGHIRNEYTAGTLPHQVMARTGMAGWLVDRVPIDKRTTFFSRNGQWLDFCCAVCLIWLIIMLAAGRFLFRKGPKSKRRKVEV